MVIIIVIDLSSRDEEGVGVAHKANSSLVTIFPNDDEAVLVRPKKAFKLIRDSFNKLLQNFI